MRVKRRLIQLETLFSEMTPEYIDSQFTIEDVCNGDVVFGIFLQHMLRYIYLQGETLQQAVTAFGALWTEWLAYRQPEITSAIATLSYYMSDIDPTADYRMSESEIKLKNDGDKTVETKNKYDYTSTETALASNKPTTERYTTTYDSTSDRLESKSISSGSTETHVVASDDTKNMKTATTSHTAASMTIDGTTYSADYIHNLTKFREGNIHKSPAEITKQSLELYKHSLLCEYIYEFLQKYTFYVGYMGEGAFT